MVIAKKKVRKTEEVSKKTVKNRRMNTFTRGYVAKAIWADLPEDCEAMSIHPDCIPSVVADCDKFQKKYGRLLAAAYRSEAVHYGMTDAGGDFWLSRRGHATNFATRGLGEVGEKLDTAAEAFGPVELTCGRGDQARWIFIE